MIIYNTKQEAYAKAMEIKRKHSDAEIGESEITFGGNDKDGKFIEKTYPTIEVWYERYDQVEGWMDCTAVLIYRTNE